MNAFFRKSLAATAIWIVSAAPAFAAGPDWRKWSHVAPVEVAQQPAKGLVELALPPELLAVARQDLADVRLATQSGDPVPHVVRVDRGEAGRSVSYRPQRMFNPVFVPNKQSMVTVDFGSRAARSRVDIDTPGTNFRRRVTVEAGADGESWQILRAGEWLFRIAYESGTHNKNEISLPDNDFRYLRITVFNAPDDPEQVPIREVTAWYIQRTPPKAAEVQTRAVTPGDNSRLRATEIDVDLGYENLPLSEVALSFEDSNFLRRVEILGRNARTRTVIEAVENSQPRKREVEEPWANLTAGTVYRLPGGKGEEASTGSRLPVGGQCRYLLVRIYNGDNAPLKFTALKVFRLQNYVGFQAEAPGPYRLYAGNALAERPQYDLEQFAGRLRETGVTEATLGPITPNPLFAVETKVAPWSERYAWLLWVSLGVVLLVLGVLVARQARHAKPVT